METFDILLIILAALLVLSLVLAWGSYSISSGFYLKALCSNKKAGKVLHLSFDDGPTEFTPDVLDILAENNIQASFFVIGKYAKNKKDVLTRIVEEGHVLGNHSYSHHWFFPLKTYKEITEEIQDTEEILSELRQSDVHWFRPPFGVTNPRIAMVCRKMNFQVAGWSVRSLDTMKKSPEQIVERVFKKIRQGDIILLHDRMPEIGTILEIIIRKAKNEGYSFVGLDELNMIN